LFIGLIGYGLINDLNDIIRYIEKIPIFYFGFNPKVSAQEIWELLFTSRCAFLEMNKGVYELAQIGYLTFRNNFSIKQTNKY